MARGSLGFLKSGTLGFAGGLLPYQLGLVLLALLLVPWSGLLPDDPRRPAARRLSLAALRAIGLLGAGAALGPLPFGGRARHNIMIVPLVVLADAFVWSPWSAGCLAYRGALPRLSSSSPASSRPAPWAWRAWGCEVPVLLHMVVAEVERA